MIERKYVKFRTDMYSDTKFKIIDLKPERDLIHYVWTRIVTLAGKVNLEGDLYMSKNLPYTIETLSIEFNRSEEQTKLALEVFIELEMLEITDGNIYRVKNFAKHQNIKMKEKIKSENKEHDVKNIEAVIKEASQNEICDNEEKKSNNKDKESKNNVDENEVTDIRKHEKRDSQITSSEIGKVNNIILETIDNRSQDNIPIPFEIKKNKKVNKKRKKEGEVNITDEGDNEDDDMFCFTEGEIHLGEGERVISAWVF